MIESTFETEESSHTNNIDPAPLNNSSLTGVPILSLLVSPELADVKKIRTVRIIYSFNTFMKESG